MPSEVTILPLGWLSKNYCPLNISYHPLGDKVKIITLWIYFISLWFLSTCWKGYYIGMAIISPLSQPLIERKLLRSYFRKMTEAWFKDLNFSEYVNCKKHSQLWARTGDREKYFITNNKIFSKINYHSGTLQLSDQVGVKTTRINWKKKYDRV